MPKWICSKDTSSWRLQVWKTCYTPGRVILLGLGTVFSLTKQTEDMQGSPFPYSKALSWHHRQIGNKAIVIRRRVSSFKVQESLVQEMSHTQPYSYHTVCWSPPGSGDAGVLLELFP